jgi:hypothetical protein
VPNKSLRRQPRKPLAGHRKQPPAIQQILDAGGTVAPGAYNPGWRGRQRLIWPLDRLYVAKPRYVVKPVLTPDECDALAEWAEREKFPHSDQVNRPGDTSIVNVCSLYPQDDPFCEELYHRVAKLFVSPSVNIWNFGLSGIYECFQLLKYPAPTGCCTPHTDYDVASEDRSKITMILFLTDGFEGGQLSVQRPVPTPAKGEAVFFPAFSSHSVTTVTKGVRTVVAGWASGPDIH